MKHLDKLSLILVAVLSAIIDIIWIALVCIVVAIVVAPIFVTWLTYYILCVKLKGVK